MTLEQPLQVPAGRARAYVQGGAVIQRDDVNRFIPYCYFRLRGNSDHPRARTIAPGDFETGPVHTRGGAAHGALWTRRVASASWPLLLAQAQGGVARLTYVSEIPLHGASDARVERLVCAYDGEPTDGFLDLARIRTALAPIVSIRTP